MADKKNNTVSNADRIKENYLNEVLNYDEDSYRKEIRNKADKFGVKYKENYNYSSDQKQFGTKKKNNTTTIIIITIVTLLIGTGTYFYFTKYRKNGKKK